MIFTLPELPYKNGDLAPILSKETLDYHYGKHHQTYINNLNQLIAGHNYENDTLETIIKSAEAGPLLNNASQCFNHSFYWQCLSPTKSQSNTPSRELNKIIADNFDNLETFKNQFSDLATRHFGSGWVWLVKTKTGKLALEATHDAGTPIKDDLTPLLTIDVWEHAYYIDYRNNRSEYINKFWQIVNWNFVEQQYIRA